MSAIVGVAKHPTAGIMVLVVVPSDTPPGANKFVWKPKSEVAWEPLEDNLLKEKACPELAH